MAHASKYRPRPLTDVFTSDSDIDRRTCSRRMPIRVLILGMGRTGTASMREALRQLGYVDTYHMLNCSTENPPDALMWMDALCAKYDGQGRPYTRADWDRLLGEAQAVCDWPAVAFAPELIEAYPEAKVILTTRDVDEWHASVLRTVDWRATDWQLRWLARADWAAGMYRPMLGKLWEALFAGDFAGRGRAVFARHYAEVRRLDFCVATDGWGPLCRFLGEAEPGGRPFPRVNEGADFVARSRRRNRAQVANVGLRWSVWLAAAAAAAAHWLGLGWSFRSLR